MAKVLEKLKPPTHFCTYPNCGKAYHKPSDLKAHKLIHEDIKPFQCSIEGCNASYSWKHHLVRHTKKSHSRLNTGEFKCAIEGCLSAFETEHKLKQHFNRRHYPRKTEMVCCTYCTSQFKEEWQLKEHEASHTNCIPFTCEYCNVGFLAYTEYKKHLPTHGVRLNSKHERVIIKKFAKTFKCTKCDKTFKKWQDLLHHRRTLHTGYHCDVCGARFSSSSSLHSHREVHTEKRVVFKCSHDGCKSYFLYKKNLNHHVRVAHEGKRFKCPVCQVEFSSSQKLKSHRITQHEMDPMEKSRKRDLKSISIKFSRHADPLQLLGFKKTGPKVELF